ncbi:metallophosphoesterase [Thermodesulfobacteriota bacterium]
MWRLILFLVVFTAIYGSLHFYAFIKARKAFSMGPGGSILIALFMAVMLFAPIIVRVMDRAGYDDVPRVLAFAGFIWMGFLFLFFCSSLVMDVWNLLVRAAALILGTKSVSGLVPPRITFFVALLCAVTITGYGYFQALDIRTRHITISSPKIPKEAGRIRVAQISDVHLGMIVGKARLQRILDQVKAADPDIFVATGDLLDGQMDDVGGLMGLFQEVTPAYGKFAVTGNHELYVGLERSLAFMAQAGFRVLRNEGIRIPGRITIAGVDDEGRGHQGMQSEISDKAVLAKLPQEGFILFLKHRPELENNALEYFDLQLSGHTHGGQIFPFSLISKIFYPIGAGLYALEGPSYLYVSRGTGTWGPPIRFLAPPEVTIIDLIHGKEKTISD